MPSPPSFIHPGALQGDANNSSDGCARRADSRQGMMKGRSAGKKRKKG